MKINPIKEESNLLYAVADMPAASLDTEIIYPVAVISVVSPSYSSYVPWISFAISLIALEILFINKFRLIQKTKKDNSMNEERKFKYMKRRKIYLSIINIFIFIFYACVISVSCYDITELIEMLYITISGYCIITIIGNSIKYIKSKNVDREKYLKIIEKNSIALPIITLVATALNILIEL